MHFDTLLKSHPQWISEDNGDNIVVTSRVRLARNVIDAPFPGWAKEKDRVQIRGDLKKEILALKNFKSSFCRELESLNKIQKQVLVERHLISREHAAKGIGSASVIDNEQAVSIMINEEDHLRMQAIINGLQLQKTYKIINEIDDQLSKKIDFAFKKKNGYLTACPSNLGTGMRASVMLHLPALVISDQIKQVIEATSKLELTVRGIYGEGTEALANLFQISNQSTLGEDETTIIKQLEKIVQKIIEHEKNARSKIMEKKPEVILDNIGRAYGILKYSHTIYSKEALNHLSMLRLGGDLGFFPQDCIKFTEELITEIQPAHIQIHEKRQIESKERDIIRAKIIREKLKELPEPQKK